MKINKRQVKRREIQIRIRDRQKHRFINRRIPNMDLVRRLVAPALILSSDFEGRVRQVYLADPREEFGGSGNCADFGDVAVVRSHGLAWCFPFKEYLAAGEGQRFGSVAGDAWAAVVA